MVGENTMRGSGCQHHRHRYVDLAWDFDPCAVVPFQADNFARSSGGSACDPWTLIPLTLYLTVSLARQAPGVAAGKVKSAAGKHAKGKVLSVVYHDLRYGGSTRILYV